MDVGRQNDPPQEMNPAAGIFSKQAALRGGLFFHYIGKFSELSYVIKKPSGQERTATEWNDVAEATRRRRRIPRAGFFLHQQRVFRAGIEIDVIGQPFCDIHIIFIDFSYHAAQVFMADHIIHGN